jgi:transposase
VTAQHRLLIRHVLAPVDFLEQPLAELTAQIEAQLAPLAEAVALLQTIPGVAEAAATTMVAQSGVDLSRFPSAKRLASWAGLCPGKKQRGGRRLSGRRLSGRRLSGRTTAGKVWLRAVLGEVAWAITHPSGTYLAALDHRLARRRGNQQAIVARAHRLLVSIYHLLRDHQPYHDLGPGHFDRLDTTHIQRRYIHRLEQLGSAVTLTPAGGA